MKRPIGIWFCLVVSGLLALVSAWGLLGDLMRFELWVQARGVVRAALVVTIQGALTAFLVAVCHAAIARPRWGRVLCGLFAVLLAASLVHGALHPDPHPLFKIEPGAEEAGAFVGQWTMVALALLYAWRMLFGAPARAYFSSRTPSEATASSGRVGAA